MERTGLDISRHLQTRKLYQEVENRTAYTLDEAELSIFETREQVYKVDFSFNMPLLASMVRGRKVMHVGSKPEFEFLPGQTMILTPGESCLIDFPEASAQTPTECIKLAIAPEKIARFCDILNEKYPLVDVANGWNYTADSSRFINDVMINQLLNRLVLICTENNEAKDFFANLVLQELVVRLMQTQAKQSLLANFSKNKTTHRFSSVVEYIQSNLHENITIKDLSRKAYMSEPHFFRCFKQQFGITPIDFINEQRIKTAKMMLHAADRSVTEISFSCGFNNLNYFLKMFKRHTGLTPAQYRKSLLV